jgi:hypothetical protein
MFGGIYSFHFASKLHRFKVPVNPPKSRADLSLEERRRKIQIATWLCIGGGLVMLVGAALLLWLENSN